MNDNTLEQNFTLLEEILEKLDDPGLSLEASFDEYKRGMEILKNCKEAIDRVEKKIMVLGEEEA